MNLIEKLNEISDELTILRDKEIKESCCRRYIRGIQDIINNVQSLITEIRYMEEPFNK